MKFAILFATSLPLVMATSSTVNSENLIGLGVFGPLTAYMIFKYIPDQNRQIASMIATKDQQIGQLVAQVETMVGRFDVLAEKHAKMEKEQRADFVKALKEHGEMRCRYEGGDSD